MPFLNRDEHELDQRGARRIVAAEARSVLTGVTGAEQVVANAAAERWELSPEEL